ncbi:MAG: hypothetical protein HRF51_00345 [bacterium]|jgi:hypothetical protein
MIGTIVLLNMSAVQSQVYYAYKESGEAVNLTVQDTVITAKLVDGLPFSWISVYALDSALNEDIPPEPLCDDFYRLRVIPGNDPEELVERLRAREEIFLANVSFLDPKNNPIYITETFVANFNLGVTSDGSALQETKNPSLLFMEAHGDPSLKSRHYFSLK